MNLRADTETRVRLRTNAKLNLLLSVAGRRPDGYHELESIFHGIGLGDDIYIELTSSGRVEVDMRMDAGLTGEIPASEENLASKVAESLLEHGAINPGVKIDILKRIPLASGLGGGSGNAAGVLLALKELWEMELDQSLILKIAGSIGSDVPYCIGGGTALATKRGEELTALPAPESMWFVLGISNEPLYTKDVYDRWDDLGQEGDAKSAPMTLALGVSDVDEVAALLHNDLEVAAFSLRPELRAKKELLLDAGALGAAMTGSGPTVYGIARDEEHALSVAKAVEADFDRVVTVSSSARCVELLD